MIGFGGVAYTYPSTSPVNEAKTRVIKAKDNGIKEMEDFPGSGRDEDVHETSDTIDTMKENVQDNRKFIFQQFTLNDIWKYLKNKW